MDEYRFLCNRVIFGNDINALKDKVVSIKVYRKFTIDAGYYDS